MFDIKLLRINKPMNDKNRLHNKALRKPVLFESISGLTNDEFDKSMERSNNSNWFQGVNIVLWCVWRSYAYFSIASLSFHL